MDMITLRTSARNQDARAQALLGDTYRRGEGGTRRDYTLALEWIRASAKQKHPLGLYNLAVMYQGGLGLTKDSRKADYLFKMALPGLTDHAGKGDALAQLYLAAMYHSGQGVERDKSKAMRLYGDAAKAGFDRAQYEYANLFFFGNGLPKNYDTARTWYRSAADNRYAPAAYRLGLMYYHGKGADLDYEEAARWFRIGAEKQHVLSQHSLGMVYYEGKGAKKNLIQAEQWLRLAADAGHVHSQYMVGKLYLRQARTDKEQRDAVKWIRRAADQGDVDAQKELAKLKQSDPTITRSAETKEELAMENVRRTRYKTTKKDFGPPVILGIALGMEIDDACERLNSLTAGSFKVRQHFSGNKYEVSFNNTHKLLTAGSDKKITSIDLVPQVVDKMFRATTLEGIDFMKAFVGWMHIPELQPGPKTVVPHWEYVSPSRFELKVFSDRRIVLKSLSDND